MSLANKLKNAGLWQMFQVASQMFIQFGYMAVMARLLSKDDFGVMAIASAFMGLGMIFSTGGMGSALIQRKNMTHKHIEAAFQGSLLLGLFVFFVLFVFSSNIAVFYNEPKLSIVIKIIGFAVVLNSISSISRSLLQKSFRFKLTANITILINFISYSLGVILAFLDYGVWSLISASLSLSFLTALLMFYYAPIKISFNFYYEEFKQLFFYGFGIVLLSLSNYLANGGLSLILGKVFSPALLGVFERTYIIKTLPSQYLGDVLDAIMFPAMSEIQDDEKKLFEVYQYAIGIVNSVLIPTALFLVFYSKEIILILLGSKWLEAVIPLQIMFAVLPLSSTGRMADALARAKGYVYRNALRKFIYALVLILSTSLSAKYYGLVGAAVAVTFSFFFNYCLMLLMIRNIFRRSIFEIFFQPLLAGMRISLIVLSLILLSTLILDNWMHESIIDFFLSSFFVLSVLILIAWKKPGILGFYLSELIYRFFPYNRN